MKPVSVQSIIDDDLYNRVERAYGEQQRELQMLLAPDIYAALEAVSAEAIVEFISGKATR